MPRSSPSSTQTAPRGPPTRMGASATTFPCASSAFTVNGTLCPACTVTFAGSATRRTTARAASASLRCGAAACCARAGGAATIVTIALVTTSGLRITLIEALSSAGIGQPARELPRAAATSSRSGVPGPEDLVT
jgi:hypothetical protein